ncbi:MAG: deoxyribodipyrimidine photolyase [Burkholderiales bacterium]|nr:MAG: deoxyribodipyrimidine photolyase [Burkholderiales bacterium]
MSQLPLLAGETGFEPTPEAARARLEAVDPGAYARTRNALDGAVTRLSPYLTHGLLDVPEALAAIRTRHHVPVSHKLAFEFGWREYFRHAWRHLGEGVLADVRPPPWSGRYASAMPADILEARTGVPAIDHAVRELHATGWLHNHARMWVASYVVHLRKVHWRAGADWMHAHLLDGDLGANHLSWQWVAATFSAKPYVFDAGNVARYAPRAWQCGGTVVDRSYEALDALARGAPDVGPEPADPRGRSGPRPATEPPAVHASPPADALAGLRTADEPAWLAEIVAACAASGDARVRIVHPWSLGAPREGGPATRVGLLHAPYHSRFPWSSRRWAFVLGAMRTHVEGVHLGDARRALDALLDAGLVPVLRDALVPGWREAIEAAARRGAVVEPVPREWDDPDRLCGSFTRFWNIVSR